MNTKIFIILATALAILPFSYGDSLGSIYELDASKKSELFKGRYQKTTKMQFTVDIKLKKLGENSDNLTAQLFVFATKMLTDEDVIHYKETFTNINLCDEREFSAETKQFNIIDKHGANPTSVDKEYKGFLLQLTDASGKVLAVRTTHPHFEKIINRSKKK